jgi:hypothetical protein
LPGAAWIVTARRTDMAFPPYSRPEASAERVRMRSFRDLPNYGDNLPDTPHEFEIRKLSPQLIILQFLQSSRIFLRWRAVVRAIAKIKK